MLYRDAHASIADRVADLLSRMTLGEKIAQLQAMTHKDPPLRDGCFCAARARERFPDGVGCWGWPQNISSVNPGSFNPLPMAEMVAGEPSPIAARGVTAIINSIQRWAMEETRLGIPVLFHVEALHGMGVKEATSLPQAIAMGASWDPELVTRAFAMTAREGRSCGIAHVLSPTLDVARDPRYGRIEECYSGDPFLAGCIAVGAVRGLQGGTLGPESVLATLKHFAAYIPSRPAGATWRRWNAGNVNCARSSCRYSRRQSGKAGPNA